MKELRINEKFRDACPVLTEKEINSLESLIIKDGVIFNPILVWNDVIIDGHNRFFIAKKHGIEFTIKETSFDSDEEAIVWIKENAISQRNLNDYQRSKLVLELEEYYKIKAKERQKEHGDTAPNRPKTLTPMLAGVNEVGEVRDQLAKKAGVSHGTIDKVRFIDNNAIQEIKEQLENNEISINKAFNITREPIKEPDEIDNLESAARSLDRWISNYNSNECLFEFMPTVSDIIEKIRDKKTTYSTKNDKPGNK